MVSPEFTKREWLQAILVLAITGFPRYGLVLKPDTIRRIIRDIKENTAMRHEATLSGTCSGHGGVRVGIKGGVMSLDSENLDRYRYVKQDVPLQAQEHDEEYEVDEGQHTPKKNPAVATFLCLILPGLGQIYNGQTGKGIMFAFLGIITGSLSAVYIGFIIITLPFWILTAYDANTTAKKINSGEVITY